MISLKAKAIAIFSAYHQTHYNEFIPGKKFGGVAALISRPHNYIKAFGAIIEHILAFCWENGIVYRSRKLCHLQLMALLKCKLAA